MPLTLEEFTDQLAVSYETAAWLETLPTLDLATVLEDTLWHQAPALTLAHDLLGEVIARLRSLPQESR